MASRRTYLDSGVLIAAWQGKDEVFVKAMAILDDPNRVFVISDFLRLETLPKPRFLQRLDEVAFMEAVFARAVQTVVPSSALTTNAIQMACTYDLAPLDALHISAALEAQVDEFVTAEKTTKPMFRVKELQVTSLRTS